MADTVSKKKRSEIMSAIKSKETKLEIGFRKALWKAGLRYRKNPKNYFGKPDVVFKKLKTVIFVDSCFWHGCRWHGSMPASNRKFWRAKINRNKERDKEVNREYKRRSWKVLRLWEHQIKKEMPKIIFKIKRELSKKIY